MEEPAGGGSGSMAINLPLHSHLGPINCCPCHLLGTPVLSIPRLHSSQVSTAWDVSARSRQQGRHSKTKDILIENNRLVGLGRQDSLLPFFFSLHLLIWEYTEVPQCLTEISVCVVHLQQFKTFDCSERLLHGAMVFSSTHWRLLNLGKCSGILYRVKCHRFNLTPLEPGCLLIWTYRDVAAEHHKGAAYQHRCYLVCLFHRGVRSPPCTHTYTRCRHQHHWIQIKGICTGWNTTSLPMERLPSVENIWRLGQKNPGCALKYICPTCSTNCPIDVYLYRINMLFEGSLDAAFGVDKGADGKSCCEFYRKG